MKRILLVISILLVYLFVSSGSGLSAAASESHVDPVVLCLPGVYLQDPGGCVPGGPSVYLTHMAQMGITFPISPLPATPPDPALTYVEFNYGEVRTSNAPVYGSLEDALKANKKAATRRIDSNFSYISYKEDTVVDGKRFYMVAPGEWMTANDVSRIGHPSLFQGLTFQRTPDNAFGWILAPVQSKLTPGTQNDDYTGRTYNRYDVVQVYTSEKIGDEEWYMIGPDEWIPDHVDWQRSIGRVIPNPVPPKGVTGDRWIEVNLFEQTISVYEHDQLVYASLVASGIEPFWTRPGLFQIYQKLDSTPMRGAFEPDRSDAYYLEDVPWTMYFDEARALHGAYWHNGFGFPRSHGCVNLSVGDAHWIYNWANLGDWVYVWDPSGKTPVDPKLYTPGGA